MALDKIVTVYEQDMTKLKADTDEAIARNLKLESSAKKAGDAGTAAFNKSAQSVDHLNDELARLESLLSKAANPKSVATLNAEIEKTKAKISAATQAQNNFGNAVSGTSSKVKDFQANITKVGAAIGIAFGVQQVIQFGASSVRAFADAEKAATQLLFALRGREDIQKRLITQAEELQKATVFEDDAIVSQQAFLATQGRTEAQIRKTIQAAVQLATVTGDTLEGAVQKLDATYEGNIGRLGKLDSGFKDLTQTELENGAAIDLVASKYAGFAESAAETTAGKLEQMKNSWGDFKERVGEVLLNIFDGWKSVSEGIAEGIDALFNTRRDDFGPESEGAKIAILNLRLKQYNAELEKTNISQERREKILGAIELTENKLRALGVAIEGDKQKASKRTIESLEAEIRRKQELMKEEEIGSSGQKQLLKEITKLQEELIHATGGQTEAEKKLADEQKAAAEKQKQVLAEQRKAREAFALEIYKQSQDARGQELVDLDTKARAMQVAGIEQLKIDEFIRSEELKINKKYDDLEEEQHKKTQDEMLADLEALVDYDEDANNRRLANTKKTEEQIREIRQRTYEAAVELGNALADLGKSLLERQTQEIEAQQTAELEALDAKFGKRKEAETAYEKEKREIEEKFAKERAQVKRKEAILDKALALFSIGINTAQAIMKNNAELGFIPAIPVNVLTALAGLAQAAAVIAKPLPAFEKGGKIKGGEQIIRVNEKGEEFVVNADSYSKKQREAEALNISPAEFDRLIYKDYITPALKRQKQEFAQNLAASLRLQQGNFSDKNLLRAIASNKQVELGPATTRTLLKGFKSLKNPDLPTR